MRLRLEGRGAPAPPAGAGEGITEWALRGLAAGVARSLDGLPTRVAAGSARGAPEGSAAHPNGALAVDHVVAATPDLERTFAALAAAGLELRRVRDAGPTARQGFYRVGEAVLEVVGPVRPDGDGPARFWGLVVVVADLDTAVARLGPLVGPPRPAVQPGRRIATVRPAAGLACALALMTPRPLSR